MKLGWLATAGAYRVEHVPCPDYAGNVVLSSPAKGVLHTTEGSSIEGALAVFKRHYAPHFLVGRDLKGNVRILQLLPLGRAASALENHEGGVETNALARAQIEVVGFSKRSRWTPDNEVTKALAALLRALEDACGIPLKHVANASRDAVQWATQSGWFGHDGVPENAHWDPGALDYEAVFALAPARTLAYTTLKARKGFFSWVAWRLGEGDWKAYGKANPKARPNVPKSIPLSWWRRLAAFLAGRA